MFSTYSISRAEKQQHIKIVVLGDSLSAGYKLDYGKSFPDQLQILADEKKYKVKIINASISGDTMADGAAKINWSVPNNTDGVIIELGSNDMLRGFDPTITEKKLRYIVNNLKKRGISAMIAGSRAPVNLGENYTTLFNSLFTRVAQDNNLKIYPFFLDGVAGNLNLTISDGLHPNVKGIKLMAKKFFPIFEKFLLSIINKSK